MREYTDYTEAVFRLTHERELHILDHIRTCGTF